MSVPRPAIRLTPRAVRDIENIILFTERTWGEEQSTAYASAITRALDVLLDHPKSGRQRDKLIPGCRSVQVEQHAIYYRLPHAGELEVLRVLHHRQDASALIGDPRSSVPDKP